MIGLEEEMTYRVTTRGPLDTTEGSPWGARQYWEMAEATLSGPRISAELAMPGGDWMAVSDDGAVVLMRYTGLVEQNPDFTAAAEEDRETCWLNESLCVARGRLLGTGKVEYTTYRVT